MAPTKRKIRAALVLLAGLAAVAGGRPEGDDNLAARVDKRVQSWQPTKDERRLDDIGWARDIRDALSLAQEHARPVFLFTYSGSAVRAHAMALQRC